MAALLEAATVWIVGEDAKGISQGSGFLVGEGFVATNAHVVESLGQGTVIYVLNDKLPAVKAQIVAQVHDRGGRDFALLRFSPPQGAVLPVLTLNLEVKRMDRVSAWGYPAMVTQFDKRTDRLQDGDRRGLKAPPVVYTEGAINSIVSGQAGEALIHSAQIAGGNSGGPLVNSRGEVVGINTWGYTEEGEGAFLNAALPAGELAAFLAANGVNPKLVSGQHITARYEEPPPTIDRPISREERPGGSKLFHPGRLDSDDSEDRVRDVGSFTVRVPSAWSVLEEEEDSIFLGADDDSAMVIIAVEKSEGKSLKEVSRELAKEFGGTRPASDDGGETYTFTFSDDNVEYMALLGSIDEDLFVMVFIGGDADNRGIQQILDSVTDK